VVRERVEERGELWIEREGERERERYKRNIPAVERHWWHFQSTRLYPWC